MLKSIQVCGTSGSGKTTLVRRLYKDSGAHPIAWLDTKTKTIQKHPTKKPIISVGHHPFHGKLYFLGSYESVCGGCDTIPSVKLVAECLQILHDQYADGVCLFEGLMISHMIGTVGDQQCSMGLNNHWRAYLDTELRQCLDNVLERRKARGQTKPFNPSNTQKDWPRVRQSRDNWIKLGGVVRDLRFQQAQHDLDRAIEDLRHDRHIP